MGFPVRPANSKLAVASCHGFPVQAPLGKGLCPMVTGSVHIGMGFVTTCLAFELGLALAVSTLTMTTPITSLAAIRGVDEFNRDSSKLCFVDDETTHLSVRPRSKPIARIATPSRDPFADAIEVFDGDPTTGAFGGVHDLLADHVVLVTAKSCFLVADTFHLLVGVFRSLASQPLPLSVVLLADLLDIGSRVVLAVAVGGQINDPQVNPDKVGGIDGCPIGDIDRDHQEPLAVGAQHEVALSLVPADPLGLVATHDKWDQNSAADYPQAYAVDPLETHDSWIVCNRRVLAKLGLIRLASLAGFNYTVNTENYGLSRQAKPILDFSIEKLLSLDLIENSKMEQLA